MMGKLPLLTEADWQRQVTDLAELLGYDWAHFRPAQTGRGWRTPVSGTIGAGWPDLMLLRERDGRVLFIECKAEAGTLTPQQRYVLNLLAHCGQTVHVLRPSDGIDAVTEILR